MKIKNLVPYLIVEVIVIVLIVSVVNDVPPADTGFTLLIGLAIAIPFFAILEMWS